MHGSYQLPAADLAANCIPPKEQIYTVPRSLVENMAPAQTHNDQTSVSGTSDEN